MNTMTNSAAETNQLAMDHGAGTGVRAAAIPGVILLGLTRFAMLMRREYWEHRGAFFWTPLVVSVLLVALMLLGLILAWAGFTEGDAQTWAKVSRAIMIFAAQSDQVRGAGLTALLVQPATLMGVVLAVVVFFYLLGSLYDDRKDRSILFWKSLPVSDWQLVMSKLATALITAPVMFLMFTLAIQFLTLVTLSVVAMALSDVAIWNTFWSPAQWHQIVFLKIAVVAHFALWWLPLAGWLLLASSMARRAVLLHAVLPPVLLVGAEVFLNSLGVVDTKGVAVIKGLAYYLRGGIDISQLQTPQSLDVGEALLIVLQPGNMLSVAFICGLIAAVMMLVGAVAIRRYWPEV